ncbi:hypothetical protein C882_0995 [Caenispirillum salinarum AK4]|uniref:DUF420 domain-containing protein n=1 Tax=Caenispirillum salinarum AK4 TaxID=1238182 RepID=K9HIH4_9PROT|nr:DUF420 domain-containing protein [Caenispirillum salinarum]EKV28421.1 hypothetical protein C882_0995 [Caenispirillum salinarum AK4]
MDTATTLPHVNATLNAITIVFLVAAFWLIKQKRIEAHRKAMLGALTVSALFLASYLVYHFTAPIFVFRGEGLVRPFYYALLISHVILAALATPLILVTAWRGLRRTDARHRALARWTWPVWMYVSVSGVAVYAMLYHVYA